MTTLLQEMTESRTALVDGQLVHYYDWGPVDAATVLVCIHGWAGGGIDFYPLSHSLALIAPSVRLIALDLPGAGFSSRPVTSLGMDGYTKFLAQWFQHIRSTLVTRADAQLVPVGHSMGGHILLRTFWRYRFGPAATGEDPGLQAVLAGFDRLVLIAPDGLKGEEGPRLAFRSRSLIRKFGPLMSADMFRENAKNAYFYPEHCPPVVGELTFAAFQYQHGYAALADITMDTFSTQPLDGQLGAFKLPILLLWGKEDKVLRFRHSATFATELPQVHFYALDQCGHSVQTDLPDQVAKLTLEFAHQP